jgi:hypothetical protein
LTEITFSGGFGHGGSPGWLQHEEGQTGNLTVGFNGGGATWIGPAMRRTVDGESAHWGSLRSAERKCWERGWMRWMEGVLTVPFYRVKARRGVKRESSGRRWIFITVDFVV